MKTKEKVLQILQNKNQCVSGEFLANECEVSRAAVWKAVKSLRDDGFLIEGTTNGGYKLLGQNDLFSKEAFSSDEFNDILETNTMDKISILSETDLKSEYGFVI